MLELLRGKKTYILMGLAIGATLFLVWQGTMTVEQAVPAITVALGFIGFRDALAQALAKFLAEFAEAKGREHRERPAAAPPPRGGPGQVRRV